MKVFKSAVCVLGIIFLSLNCVYAQNEQAGKEDIYKELSLSPQQQKKLDQNRKTQREASGKLRTSLEEKENQLRLELSKPQVNKSATQSLISQIKDLQGQLIDERVKGIYAVKEILLPEQMDKLNKLIEARRQGYKQRMADWQKKHREVSGQN